MYKNFIILAALLLLGLSIEGAWTEKIVNKKTGENVVLSVTQNVGGTTTASSEAGTSDSSSSAGTNSSSAFGSPTSGSGTSDSSSSTGTNSSSASGTSSSGSGTSDSSSSTGTNSASASDTSSSGSGTSDSSSSTGTNSSSASGTSSSGSGTSDSSSSTGTNSASASDTSSSGTGTSDLSSSTGTNSAYVSSSSSGNSVFNSISANASKKATSLNVSNSGLTDLNGIEVFTNLEVLNLENNHLESLKGLENLTNLKRLYLRGNPLTPSDLEIILSLKNLQFLSFSDISGNYLDVLYVFVPDKNLKSVVWENIQTFPKYTSTEDKITFEDVAKIKELHCRDKKIKDLRGIEHFKNLQLLDLEENMIRTLYKIDFSELNKLEYLNIAGNEISSLEKFEEFLPIPNKHLDIYFQKDGYTNPIVSSPNFVNIVRKIKTKFNNKIDVIT